MGALPKALDRLIQRGAGKIKAQQNLARFAFIFHFRVKGREKADHAFARLAETDSLADFEPLARPNERPPTAIVDALNQRRFD